MSPVEGSRGGPKSSAGGGRAVQPRSAQPRKGRPAEAAQARTGQARQGGTGQARAGQSRTGQARTGQARQGGTGQARTGQSRTGQARTGQARAGQPAGGHLRSGQPRPGVRAASPRAGGQPGRRQTGRPESAEPFNRHRRRDDSLGGDQIEGRRAVKELLLAGRREVREIWVSEGRDPAAILEDIEDLARAAGVPIRMVGEARLQATARTDAPQGVVAFAEELRDHTLEELVLGGDASAAADRLPFLVVLDGITDPHNLGALLRTAECAGATGAVLGRHHAVHVTPTAAKAAAGAIERLPMSSVAGIPSALQELSALGVWNVALDADADRSLFDLDLVVATSPIALVFGSEGKGLKRLTKERCDVVASIPMFGELDSLNVSAAGAVACFEVARRRASGARGGATGDGEPG